MKAPNLTQSWEDIIADVAEDEDYMNGFVSIWNPNAGKLDDYDVETGQWGTTGGEQLWYGPGRIQHIYASRGSNLDGGSNRNPTGMRTVVFQVPIRPVTRAGVIYAPCLVDIQRGFLVRVEDGGRNPLLEENIYTVDSAQNSSHAVVQSIVTISNVETVAD